MKPARSSIFNHLVSILTLWVISSLACSNTIAQGIFITENFNKVSLSKIFKRLKNKYDLKIAYDNQLVQDVTISAQLEDLPLSDALEKILSQTELTHQIINGKVIIIPKTNSSSDKISKPNQSSVHISGMIKDDESGEQLPNATVVLVGTNHGAITNTDGYFTIMDVPSDTCTLLVQYLGYGTKKVKLSTVADLSKIAIGLRSETQLLEDVIVTDQSESPLQIDDEVSKSAFNTKALAHLPSLAGQDLFRTLQLMPGVSGTNESSSGLMIRGSVPSQNLILLDGFTIYHLDHFFGIFSGLNADIIKDVQIYKGGFDSKYGGRVSGVVDITGRQGSTTKSKFSLGANLISVNATADIPISKKISFLFATRRAYTDVIQSSLYKKLFTMARDTDEQVKRPVENPLFNRLEPEFYFYDVNSKITYRPSQKDNITLSLYGGKDRLYAESKNSQTYPNNISFEDALDEHTQWGNNGLSLRWGRQWNERFYSNLRLTGSTFFRNYDFTYTYKIDSTDFSDSTNYTFVQENKIDDSNLAFDNEWMISEKVTMEFGFSGMEYTILYKTIANGEDPANNKPAEKGNIASFYTTGKFTFTERLSAAAGIRSTHHTINDQWYNEPRLSVCYKISDRLSVKSAIGTYYQFVNQVQYDDPYNGIQNFWAFANKEGIPVVRSNHYIAGATYRLGVFKVDVELYYKDLEGVIEYNPIPYYVKDEFLNLELFMRGKGRMRGIDFLIQKETGMHKGWLSYSWSRSLHSFSSLEKGTYFPSLQDQPHEVKLVNMVNLGKWNLSSTWMYGSGAPFPEYDVLYFKDNEGNVEDFVVVKDRKNFKRLPSYHRLDLSAAYTFKLKYFSGQVGLSIFNVYGRKNVKTRRLNLPHLASTIGSNAEPPPQYRDLVLISFTPSVFINVEF